MDRQEILRRAKAKMEELAANNMPEDRAALRDALSFAQEPLVRALRDVGADVDSVWDLVNSTFVYLPAIPVLVEHLGRDYPHQIREGIARALATRHASAYLGVLLDAYRSETHVGPKQGMACAVAACAREEDVRELIRLVADETVGSSRVLLLSPLTRLGEDAVVEPFLEGMLDDPLMGREARKTLRRRRARR